MPTKELMKEEKVAQDKVQGRVNVQKERNSNLGPARAYFYPNSIKGLASLLKSSRRNPLACSSSDISEIMNLLFRTPGTIPISRDGDIARTSLTTKSAIHTYSLGVIRTHYLNV